MDKITGKAKDVEGRRSHLQSALSDDVDSARTLAAAIYPKENYTHNLPIDTKTYNFARVQTMVNFHVLPKNPKSLLPRVTDEGRCYCSETGKGFPGWCFSKLHEMAH